MVAVSNRFSKEIRKQLFRKTGGELPDYVVACVGGGSNAAGAFYHFWKIRSVKLIAVEGNRTWHR